MAVRVISTRLALDGEKEFKQQMSSVNSELRTLKTELSYTEAAFRGQANTMEALTEKERIIKDMTAQQQEKVRALEQALVDATAAYGDSDKRTDNYRQSLLKAKKELIDMQGQLDEATQYLQEARDSTDKCATSIDEFGKEVKSSGSEMDDVDRKLRSLQEELSYTETSFRGQANTVEALTAKDRLLRKEIEQQTDKVQALEKAMDRSADAYGDNDKRTEEYRQSLYKAKRELVDMEDELKDTDKYLDEARRSTDKCATSIDEFGRETKGAEDDLGGFQGGIGDLMGSLDILKNFLVGGAMIGGLKEVSDAIFDITDSTKEYRSIMGSLEVSSAQLGYTTEQTKDAYNRLYGVLGDNQTAATTIANLQAIELSQEDLMTVIDAVTGAWSKYGDSIPIDGLAESINETIRAGEVTGTFADVINWGSDELETFGVQLKEDTEANADWNQSVQDATTAEDFFNLALQDCETQAERTQLMLDFLAKQGLTEAGQAWRDVNADIVAANESEAKMEEAMGRLGTVLSPVADGMRSFGADAINWVAGCIEDLIGWISSAVDWFKKLNQSLNEKGQQRLEEGLAKMEAREQQVDGSHAGGLDFVPFDGYTAELHYGERVMTAVENSALDTLTGAVNALKGDAHGGQAPAQETAVETLQPVIIPVHVVLDGRVVGESTTTYQMQQRRATGT